MYTTVLGGCFNRSIRRSSGVGYFFPMPGVPMAQTLYRSYCGSMFSTVSMQLCQNGSTMLRMTMHPIRFEVRDVAPQSHLS